MTGQLTLKSDVYSFGVVLLEIITGRRAIDTSRAAGEQNLIAWARPLFKDCRKFSQMADSMLQGQYPVRGLYQALAVAAMCVQEQPNMRRGYSPKLSCFPEVQPWNSANSKALLRCINSENKKGLVIVVVG